MNIQLIATYAAAVLTVIIFSYLLGDNFLYRIGVHLLVGSAAGYSLIVAVESVIIPWIKLTLIGGPTANPNFVIGLLPVLIAVLLAFKISPRLSRFGNIGLAFVLGVGGSVAIWGAVTGTLLPLALDDARIYTRRCDQRLHRAGGYRQYAHLFHVSGHSASVWRSYTVIADSTGGTDRSGLHHGHARCDLRPGDPIRIDNFYRRDCSALIDPETELDSCCNTQHS